MNKTDLIVRCLIPVLSAGLVSCAKDEKTRDVFHAPAPVIHSKSTEELKSWDRRSDKSLDLQDSFDVSAGNPAKLEVVSRCRRGQQSYYESFSLVPREPVKIFQVLPAELLTAAIENVDCGFELTLFNDVGSKHIYQINPVPVTDESAAGVTLEKSGSDEKITKIHARKLEGLRARYRNSGPAAAEVFCEESALPALPFEQVIDLNHFEFSELSGKALRACRILVRQAGRIAQISPRFLVQIPQAPVTAAVIRANVPSGPERQAFFNGGAMVVGFAAVMNPDPSGTRHLVIRKAGYESTIEIFGPAIFGHSNPSANKISFNALKVNWMTASPIASPGVGIQDEGAQWRISLPAGSSVQLVLSIAPPRPRVCAQGSFRVISEDLAVAGQISVIETSENGEPLEEKTVPFPRVSFASFKAYEAQSRPVPGIPCGW